MSLSTVRQLLEARLATWAAARAPALPVAWQNVHFSPPDTYLRPFILPAQTYSDDLAGAHRVYHGIWQINVIAPIGNGPGFAEGIGEELAALYPLNLILSAPGQSVQLTEPMSFGPAQSDSDEYTLPVFCRYRSDTI